MIATGTALALAGVAALMLLRLLSGPTLHDRALAAHGMIIVCVLATAALGVLTGRAEWIDIAIALVFGDLVFVVCVLKVFRARSLQSAIARAAETDAGAR